MERSVHPDSTQLLLSQKGLLRKHYVLSNSTITILSCQIDIIIEGNTNRLKIQDTAGKLKIIGDDTQIEITRSWISCWLSGNRNAFALLQTQFQLKQHQGEANYVPGIHGQNPQNIHRRMMHQRMFDIRINAMKTKRQSLKKYIPNLLKSKYNSEVRQCTICYDNIKPDDEITSLFCFHFFHSHCIEACLETSTRCPVCSMDLLNHIAGEIKAGQLIIKEDELLMKDSVDLPDLP